jgi:cytoskeleton protein RodZ
MQVEIAAIAPSWISMKDPAGNTVLAQLLVPGSPRALTLENGAILRTGNAGGLIVRVNGESIGELGAPGQVREIQFKDGAATVAVP